MENCLTHLNLIAKKSVKHFRQTISAGQGVWVRLCFIINAIQSNSIFSVIEFELILLSLMIRNQQSPIPVKTVELLQEKGLNSIGKCSA